VSSETGSLSVFLVALTLALFVLTGLVVDGGRAIAARENAADVAEAAARVGAGQISADHLRWGEVVTDPEAAVAASEQYMAAAGFDGTASVIDGTVWVSIKTREPTVILGLVGIDSIDVSAQAEATDVHGVTRSD